MKEFWNERYAGKEYVYGTEPNSFFKQQIDRLKTGKILLPCEGEGRNATYAALNGWDVTAFDQSEKGREKAIKLAHKNKVDFNYKISSFFDYKPQYQFDAIALIYAHFPIEQRKEAHELVQQWLKPGGTIILEAFNKRQLNYNTGGPKNLDMLFDIEILKIDFKSFEIQLLEEHLIDLNEGEFHKGKAEIIRMIAIK